MAEKLTIVPVNPGEISPGAKNPVLRLEVIAGGSPVVGAHITVNVASAVVGEDAGVPTIAFKEIEPNSTIVIKADKVGYEPGELSIPVPAAEPPVDPNSELAMVAEFAKQGNVHTDITPDFIKKVKEQISQKEEEAKSAEGDTKTQIEKIVSDARSALPGLEEIANKAKGRDDQINDARKTAVEANVNAKDAKMTADEAKRIAMTVGGPGVSKEQLEAIIDERLKKKKIFPFA